MSLWKTEYERKAREIFEDEQCLGESMLLITYHGNDTQKILNVYRVDMYILNVIGKKKEKRKKKGRNSM